MEREDPIDERTTAVMELAQQADGVVSFVGRAVESILASHHAARA
jgi:hypothetical protein